MNQRGTPDDARYASKGSLNRRQLLQGAGAVGLAATAGVVLGRQVSAAPGKAPAFLRRGNQASGEVVVSLRNGIIVQDPTLTGSVSDIAVNFQHYETLVDQPTKAGDFVGVLAESWKNVDDLTWEFKLREGVKFHNGDPFVADDVVATFERWLNPKVAAPMGPILYPTGIIDKAVAIDDHTVQIKTTSPFGGLLSSLTLTYIMPAGPTRAAGDGPIPKNIGTGPFQMTEWVQADHINLVAFDGYWGQKAKIQSLVYKQLDEDATRMAALQAGEVHILDELSQDQMTLLAGNSGFSTPTQQTVESLYPILNVLMPPFDDVRIRQAFNYGIDMGSIVQSLIGAGGTRQIAPISPEVFAFNDQLSPYNYDLDKAKSLLKDAGYSGGAELTYIVPGARYPAGQDIAQAVAASAQAIGFNVNVQVPEVNAAFSMTGNARDKWNIFQWGISAVTADPDFPLRWFFHSRSNDPYNGTSAVTWRDDQVDQLLDQGSATLDADQRATLYKQAQSIIWDQAPCLWQHHVVDIYGVNSKVQGLTLRYDKRPRLADISISG